MNVLMAVPTYENVSTETFGALWRIARVAEENGIAVSEPLFLKGHGVQRARNDIALHALEHGYDKIFTVDSDVIPPDESLLFLSQGETDVVVVPYANRYDGRMGYTTCYLKNENRLMGDNNNILSVEKIQSLPPGRIELNGAGMGCALIDVPLLRRLEYPYFYWTEKMLPNGERCECSEDMYFCRQVVSHGGVIKADTRLFCQHKMSKVI